MTSIMGTLLFMLAVLAAAAVIAERLKTAPSIVLVVAGIGMALIPGLPRIQLAPEVVLLVILPPLIYSAGVSMSWREFRFNLRPITLLAFGCVVFTTCAVAIAAHYLLNFSSEEVPDRTKAAFGDNYARLVEVKTKYDPTNFFSLNQNIKPAR